MESKHYKALAFDFDGTLFDTQDLNFKAYRLAYYDLGIEITEEMFSKVKGLSVYQFNRAMGVECDVERLRELKTKYYNEISVYAKPNEYLIDLIFATDDVPKALVTTARKVNIQPLLHKYDLDEAFDVIICQENVKNFKPAPDAYNLALEYLGIKGEDVLAFEDSRSGFVAARSAGCDCVQIGEFHNDCIVDMTGGSNSRTVLRYDFRSNDLVVCKYADGVTDANKLINEYEFLKNNKHPYLIPVGSLFSQEREKGFHAEYKMPYVFGGSFYEYQNKIGMFPEVLKRIYEFDTQDYNPNGRNHLDIRRECLERYVWPGLKIYRKVTKHGNSFELWEGDIPDFVNDFRITRYHGDTTFENIIMSRLLGPVLIDPVPYNNVTPGIVHDFAKIGQSLCGYEAIRDGQPFDYTVEKKVFDGYARSFLMQSEYQSLKFLVACLFFRRLRYQVNQNPKLVKPYGDIAMRLIEEFKAGKYSWE